MAIAKKRSSSDDDFLKVGPDATAAFDNSPSNPTEHGSSENLSAAETEDDLEDEDLDEEDEEEDYDDEDEDEDEDDDDDEEEDEEDGDEDDSDLVTGRKVPSVNRKL